MLATCQISLGEFWDKFTISQIKFERVKDKDRLVNVAREYNVMKNIAATLPICKRISKLKALNFAIWKTENEIRRLIRADDFGKKYIEATYTTIRLNDERAIMKKQIDIESGSDLVWEKEHL